MRIKTGFNVQGLPPPRPRAPICRVDPRLPIRQPARRHQSDGTVSLVYTFLGDSHFGAVEWRDEANR